MRIAISDQMAAIEMVFFDFAGTLAAGVPCWEQPQIIAAAECGRVVTPAEVKAAIGKVWGPREGCAHPEASVDEATYTRWIGAIERQILAELGLPSGILDAAARRVMELQVAPESYRIYPDAPPTLGRLKKQGRRLGLISNFAWGLPGLIGALGLADAFDLVLTSARVGYRKPRPEIFWRALAETGADPSHTLYVGDDPICDYHGARAAGLSALLLDRQGSGSGGGERIGSLADLGN